MIAHRWNFWMTWGFIVVVIIFCPFLFFLRQVLVHTVLRTLDLFTSASPMLGLRRAARVLAWICVSLHLNFSMRCHLLPWPSCNRVLHFDHKRHSEVHNGRLYQTILCLLFQLLSDLIHTPLYLNLRISQKSFSSLLT